MPDFITTSSPYLQLLDYPNLTSEEQARVSAVITASSEYLEKYLNRTILATTYAEVHSGDNDEYLILKQLPINSLTSVVFRSSINTTVAGTNFEYDSGSGELRWKTYAITTADFLNYFPKGFNNIVVNYNAGYSSIPTPLQLLVAEMVMETFDKNLLPNGIQKEKIGQYFVDYGADSWDKILFNRRRIVSMYKIRRV